MKQLANKVFAAVMALLVLLSTVSWSVDKHLCMGRTVDVALFAKAKDCGMDAAAMETASDGVHKSPCGEESFTVKGQLDLKLSGFDLDLSPHWVALPPLGSLVFTPWTIGTPSHPVPYKDYAPPLLVRDISVLQQRFLI